MTAGRTRQIRDETPAFQSLMDQEKVTHGGCIVEADTARMRSPLARTARPRFGSYSSTARSKRPIGPGAGHPPFS